MTRMVRAFKKARMWTYYPDLLARPVPRYTSYPTAAEFGDIDTGLYRQALSGAGGDISLYVHIPFCEKLNLILCDFCILNCYFMTQADCY